MVKGFFFGSTDFNFWKIEFSGPTKQPHFQKSISRSDFHPKQTQPKFIYYRQLVNSLVKKKNCLYIIRYKKCPWLRKRLSNIALPSMPQVMTEVRNQWNWLSCITLYFNFGAKSAVIHYLFIMELTLLRGFKAEITIFSNAKIVWQDSIWYYFFKKINITSH